MVGIWFTVPFIYVAAKTIPKNTKLSLFLLFFGFILGISLKLDNNDNWFKAIFLVGVIGTIPLSQLYHYTNFFNGWVTSILIFALGAISGIAIRIRFK